MNQQSGKELGERMENVKFSRRKLLIEGGMAASVWALFDPAVVAQMLPMDQGEEIISAGNR